MKHEVTKKQKAQKMFGSGSPTESGSVCSNLPTLCIFETFKFQQEKQKSRRQSFYLTAVNIIPKYYLFDLILVSQSETPYFSPFSKSRSVWCQPSEFCTCFTGRLHWDWTFWAARKPDPNIHVLQKSSQDTKK